MLNQQLIRAQPTRICALFSRWDPASAGWQRFSSGFFAGTRRARLIPTAKSARCPKLVGGLTPACLERAVQLYGQAIKTVVPVSNCRVAEAAKLLENIFRSVNIALVNELKVVYASMGIDIGKSSPRRKRNRSGSWPSIPDRVLVDTAFQSIHSISLGRLESSSIIRDSLS